MQSISRRHMLTTEDTFGVFKIISAHICATEGYEKNYVVYTLRVRHISGKDQPIAIIDRRYTHFLNLYSGLNNDHSILMSSISFPKKALMGNFDNKLISTRSSSFENMLQHIMKEECLRNSPHMLAFLQEHEFYQAKQFMSNKDYSCAIPLLENNFTLLNNIYTDRSPPVLLALCKLLGCSISLPGSPQAEKWANLALHRFDGVSDSDLLVLYIPLIQVCTKLWSQSGRDQSGLEQRLILLKQQGINCNNEITLLEAVNNVELKLSENC